MTLVFSLKNVFIVFFLESYIFLTNATKKNENMCLFMFGCSLQMPIIIIFIAFDEDMGINTGKSTLKSVSKHILTLYHIDYDPVL